MFSDVYSFIKNPSEKVQNVKNQIAGVFDLVKDITEKLPEAIKNVAIEDGGFASGYIGVNVGLEIVDPVKKLGKIVKSLKGGGLVPAWVRKSEIAISSTTSENHIKSENRFAKIVKNYILNVDVLVANKKFKVGDKIPNKTLKIETINGKKHLVDPEGKTFKNIITPKCELPCTSKKNDLGGKTITKKDPESGKTISADYDSNGFIVMPSKMDVYIDPNLLYGDFFQANKSLQKELGVNGLKIFGKSLGLKEGNKLNLFVKQIKSGSNKPPTGFVWHHHQDIGKMQLVPEVNHPKNNLFPHLGGKCIWSVQTPCDIPTVN